MEEENFWTLVDIGVKTFENETFNFQIDFKDEDGEFSKAIINHHGFKFIDCEFKEVVWFTSAEFLGDVSFTSCVFKKFLHFNGAKFKNHLILNDITSEMIYFHSGEFYFTVIQPKEVGFLQIEGGEYKNSLWITDETIENNRK